MSKKKRKNRPRKYNKNFRLLSYNITEEPVEDKYTKQIPKKIIDQIQDFQEKISQHLVSQLGIHAKITLVEPKSLKRSTGEKVKRVQDSRNI